MCCPLWKNVDLSSPPQILEFMIEKRVFTTAEKAIRTWFQIQLFRYALAGLLRG